MCRLVRIRGHGTGVEGVAGGRLVMTRGQDGDAGELWMRARLVCLSKLTLRESPVELMAQPWSKSRGRDTTLATPVISTRWRPG